MTLELVIRKDVEEFSAVAREHPEYFNHSPMGYSGGSPENLTINTNMDSEACCQEILEDKKKVCSS